MINSLPLAVIEMQEMLYSVNPEVRPSAKGEDKGQRIKITSLDLCICM